jgi:SAM-dependent methyltransferase
MNEREREPATDRARLVGAAYATPGPLAARRALYDYERDPIDLATWVLNRVEGHRPLSEHCRVVDIGCGPGRYLAALRDRHPGITTIGLDLSPGMASATRASGAPAGVADAMQLPLRSSSCDVAIAAHMLYHVPDIALAANEIARVVDPTGVVAVVTNGRDHLAALDELSCDAVAAVGGAPWTAPARSAARFLLDDAPSLVLFARAS